MLLGIGPFERISGVILSQKTRIFTLCQICLYSLLLFLRAKQKRRQRVNSTALLPYWGSVSKLPCVQVGPASVIQGGTVLTSLLFTLCYDRSVTECRECSGRKKSPTNIFIILLNSSWHHKVALLSIYSVDLCLLLMLFLFHINIINFYLPVKTPR